MPAKTSPQGFGSWLKRRRSQLDLTQDRLAQELGCALITLQKLEAETMRPSRQLAERLARCLQLDPADHAAFVQLARRVAPVPPAELPAPPSTVRRLALAPLPAPPTPLIGRDEELAAIAAQLRLPATRLLTLTGIAGIGKTRLALALAALIQGEFADGVAFVALASLREPAGLIPTLALALGLPDDQALHGTAGLASALGERQLLLVLDNFEQIIEAAPKVSELLAVCPALKVLVTSRERLRVRGERQLVVAPLELPDPSIAGSAAAIRQAPAVELFVRTAQLVAPTFLLTDENAGSIVAICARLAGLPLAIELVASRSHGLAPATLLATLNAGGLLAFDGLRDLPARQQTLRSALDWSYGLLSTAEQRRFAQLAVFRSEWTIEAATAICGQPAAGPTNASLLLELGSLVDKHLVQRQPDPGGAERFTLLAFVREYAEERLDALVDAAAVRLRHAAYFLAFGQAASTQLSGPDQQHPFAALVRNQGDLHAALDWCLASNQAPLAAELIVALTPFWRLRGLVGEGWRRFEQLQTSLETLDVPLQARLLMAGGRLAQTSQLHARAVPLLEASLALYRSIGATEQAIAVSQVLAFSLSTYGDPQQAIELLSEALQVARDREDAQAIASALNALANAYSVRGSYSEAEALWEECLSCVGKFGDQHTTAVVLFNLTENLRRQGRYREACARCAETIAMAREHGLLIILLRSLCNQAIIHWFLGELESIEPLLDEAQTFLATIDDLEGWLMSLYGWTVFALGRERLADAVQILAAAEAWRRQHGLIQAEEPRAQVQALCARLEAALGAEPFAKAWAAGAQLPPRAAVALAQSSATPARQPDAPVH